MEQIGGSAPWHIDGRAPPFTSSGRMPHGALDQSGSPLLYPRLGPINGSAPDGAPASVRACTCFCGDVCTGTMELEQIFAQVAAGQLAVSDAVALAQGPLAQGPTAAGLSPIPEPPNRIKAWQASVPTGVVKYIKGALPKGKSHGWDPITLVCYRNEGDIVRALDTVMRHRVIAIHHTDASPAWLCMECKDCGFLIRYRHRLELGWIFEVSGPALSSTFWSVIRSHIRPPVYSGFERLAAPPL